MSQPAQTPSHHPQTSPSGRAGEVPISGFYTTRHSSRLWLTRIDGPERFMSRALCSWKLAAAALLALLWSVAALLYYLTL